MIEHVYSQTRFFVNEQTGVDGEGKPLKIKALIFEIRKDERHVYPLTTEAANSVVAMLTGGVVIPNGQIPPDIFIKK